MTTPGDGSADQVVLALDVGGTHIKAAVMATDGTVVDTADAATGAERGPDAVVENILALAATLTERHRPVAAGVAVPGVVDEGAGICTFAANLGWREVPIQRWVEEELAIPVALGHDVRAGGLAEARLGAGRGCRSFLFVPVGTGIAAAIVLDGRTLLGGHGGAGELGHLVVRSDGEPCGCGNLGCLETLASASAVARRYHRATGERVTAEEVARRAEADDQAAMGVWHDAVDALADGLAATVTLLDPRRVVLGGGLARAGRSLFGPLRTALAARLTFQTLPEVVPAALGHRAGSLGAGLLALDLWQARRGARRPGAAPQLYAVPGQGLRPRGEER
ncbi:ROK family protein [Streptacidiphilus pinicola]|uniref:ROK family protein n=1 Tax=Streptacidiphilus pinicola TaxID=2219663 RepID=A0A2X0KEB1_9ACTN|nr:ROK family protein [Streptacidiphilus pinicola]RAG85499.1 ROK family protein [Streptacidiphilus pinicola]